MRRARGPEPASPRGAAGTGRRHAHRSADNLVDPADNEPEIALEHELELLADTLAVVLSIVDRRPPAWSSPAFSRQVAVVRSQLAGLVNRTLHAARLGPDVAEPESSRLEGAIDRLSSEATAVATAIRWLEIQANARFLSWADMVHGGALRDSRVAMESSEASFWFG